MKTTVRNRENLQYDLRLKNIDSRGNYPVEPGLVRGTFYDFAAKHEVVVAGFSNEKNIEFVDNLLKYMMQ